MGDFFLFIKKNKLATACPNWQQVVNANCVSRAAICLLLIVLGGCRVVGPDFDGAPIPALTTDFRAQEAFKGRPQGDPLAFWSSLSDPILDQLVGQALDQNLTVRQAAERIVEARANLQLNGGQLLPNVDANNSYSFLKRSQNARPFVGANGQSFSLFTSGFDATWEIDLFGRIERNIEAAEAELQAQHASLADLEQTLACDIASSYLTIRLLQEQITLFENSIELQRNTVELVDGRAQAGISTELDREQTNGFLFRTSAQVAALKQLLEVEFNRLSLLLGEPASDELRTFVGWRSIPVDVIAPPTGVPADLLRRRPDVRQAEAQVHFACAQIGIAEADLYPSLTLLGSISLSAKDISKMFQTESLAFNIGPAFQWNIIHFGRICNNIEIQESRLRQSISGYQQQVLEAVREVEDSLVQFDGLQKQMAQFEKARDADANAVTLSLDRYKAGRANFQRVLDAQLQLLQDSQALVAARGNSIIQLIRLYKATGGGWPGPTSNGDFVDGIVAAGTGSRPTGNAGREQDNPLLDKRILEFDKENDFESNTGNQTDADTDPTSDIGEPASDAEDGSTPWDQGSLEFELEKLLPSTPNSPVPARPASAPIQQQPQDWNRSAATERYPLGQNSQLASQRGDKGLPNLNYSATVTRKSQRTNKLARPIPENNVAQVSYDQQIKAARVKTKTLETNASKHKPAPTPPPSIWEWKSDSSK